MKKDLKKEQVIKKALKALEKQALKDQELRQIKGGGPGGWGQTNGYQAP